MTEKLRQIIKEEVIKLPKELQYSINSLDWGKISEEIGKKYLLNESEINDLQVETGLVLIGLADINEYTLNIENNVGTSKNVAEKITMEINQKIFNQIAMAISRKIEENLKNKNINWKQTLNFILSGGDYSIFMEKDNNLDTDNKSSKINILDNNSKLKI